MRFHPGSVRHGWAKAESPEVQNAGAWARKASANRSRANGGTPKRARIKWSQIGRIWYWRASSGPGLGWMSPHSKARTASFVPSVVGGRARNEQAALGRRRKGGGGLPAPGREQRARGSGQEGTHHRVRGAAQHILLRQRGARNRRADQRAQEQIPS